MVGTSQNYRSSQRNKKGLLSYSTIERFLQHADSALGKPNSDSWRVLTAAVLTRWHRAGSTLLPKAFLSFGYENSSYKMTLN